MEIDYTKLKVFLEVLSIVINALGALYLLFTIIYSSILLYKAHKYDIVLDLDTANIKYKRGLIYTICGAGFQFYMAILYLGFTNFDVKCNTKGIIDIAFVISYMVAWALLNREHYYNFKKKYINNNTTKYDI